MQKLELDVSKTAVEHGLQLGKKVFVDKFEANPGVPNKRKLQADVYGFIAECVVCEWRGMPLPDLVAKGWNDLRFKGLKIDIKKVGLDSVSKLPLITLNKNQFGKKRGRVDGFLFVSFTKGSMSVGDVQVPMPGFSKLWVLGWLPIGHVELKGKDYKWPDGDVAFKFDMKDLRPVEDLL